MLTVQARSQLFRAVAPRIGSAVPPTLIGAAISTKTQETIEGLIQHLWHDVADEVDEVGHILGENRTNRAVAVPTEDLQRRVDQRLAGVQHLMMNQHHSSCLHDQAFAKAHALKNEVKQELYNFQWPSARYFSTALSAERQVDEFEDAARKLHWSDVEDEAELIRSLLHESKTNHAVQKPSAALIDMVEKTLADLQKSMALNPSKHGKIFARLHALKGLVKGSIYAGAPATSVDEHLKEFERVMHALKWSDIEDLTDEIDHMMHEGHTNLSVRLPDADLQNLVDATLQDVQKALVVTQSPSMKNHDLAYERIHDLKRTVKMKLYQ